MRRPLRTYSFVFGAYDDETREAFDVICDIQTPYITPRGIKFACEQKALDVCREWRVAKIDPVRDVRTSRGTLVIG